MVWCHHLTDTQVSTRQRAVKSKMATSSRFVGAFTRNITAKIVKPASLAIAVRSGSTSSNVSSLLKIGVSSFVAVTTAAIVQQSCATQNDATEDKKMKEIIELNALSPLDGR
jgi:hypothetical protein